MTGCIRDQVRESFERHNVAIVDRLADRLGECGDLCQVSILPRRSQPLAPPAGCYNHLTMALSFLRKVKKILEKPVPPAHIRERNIQVVIPWHERLWREIRPPKSSAAKAPKLNPAQRRMVWITLCGLALVAAASWAASYLSNAPQRAQVAYEAGMDRLSPADFKGAIAKFTESIEIRESAAAYLERGNARSELGESSQALADWSQAIRLDPNLAEAYTARGTYYRIAGDLSRAVTDLDRSLQLMPSVDAYYQRGQVKYALKDFQQAEADYSEAIALRREAPYMYLARSVARRELGDEVGAEEDRVVAEDLQVPKSDR
jgi:tetratricopeptide (TPR) repeat protein